MLIGDVSGHGVTAGLTMMMIQTAIRTVVLSGGEGAATLTPAQVLSRVNAAVRSNLRKVDEDHYMTITGLQLQGGSVRYSGLHQDILIYRASSRAVERVETRGMWIGPVDDIAPLLRDDTLELTSGDIVLLFTDGITEAMVGGKRFGTDGLAAAFSQLAANGHDSGGILKGHHAEHGGDRPAGRRHHDGGPLPPAAGRMTMQAQSAAHVRADVAQRARDPAASRHRAGGLPGAAAQRRDHDVVRAGRERGQVRRERAGGEDRHASSSKRRRSCCASASSTAPPTRSGSRSCSAASRSCAAPTTSRRSTWRAWRSF